MLPAFAFSWLLRLLLPLTFSPSHESDPTLTDTIVWQSKRLTWDDFKGRPDHRSLTTIAMTSSGINIFYKGYESRPHITVTSTFYRKRSWVKEEGRNDDVLQHEQLHFDITELHARKLRKAIAALPTYQRSWQNIKRLYDRANDDCSAYQQRYDADTHHSILQDVQQQWNEKVAAELNAFNSYASR